jgi:hypothetical protein
LAVTYPLNTPTSIGIESIELRAVNVVSTSQSPFTFKQQVVSFPGQRWEASVSIPQVHRQLAAPWKAFLTSLKGQAGTFLLSDPDYATAQGDVSSCTLSGVTGSGTATVVMTGTLKAGDYIQLGSGSSSKLHQVLVDQTGNGTLEIWPNLRQDYTSSTVVYENAKGVFRLATNSTSWSINNTSTYGISFDAVEVLI